MSHQARTVCDPNCHANPKCGIAATIEDDKIIAIGPAEYPVPGYENRICQMGRSRLEYQYHPDRITTPLKRVGERGEGKWEPISWDEAVNLFVEKHQSIAEKYGPRSVVFTPVSGAMALLNRGSVSRYAALTGASMTSASSAFDVSVPKGLEYMFGIPTDSYFKKGGHAFADAANSEIVLLWGFNAAITRSVDHAVLKATREQDVKLVCIDPTRSETAGWCDEWVSPRPGSDGALALAMANVIMEQGLVDEEFLKAHTDMPFLVREDNGNLLREKDLIEGGSDSPLVWCNSRAAAVAPDQANEIDLAYTGDVEDSRSATIGVTSVFARHEVLIDQFTPAIGEEVTGVPAATIQSLATEFGQAKTAAIRVGYGIDRYYYADTTTRSIALLSCLTGNIGIRGGGISLHEGYETPPVRGRTFYAPDGKLPRILTFLEVDSAVRNADPYPVKMECISVGNPYTLAKPGYKNTLQSYLDGLEFIAVIDHFITDTAKWADLVLPACTIFERTDIVVDKLIQLQEPVVEPLGDSKPDFEIFGLFAEKMGYGHYFDKSAEHYISETFDPSRPLMKDVTFERLKAEKAISVWPEDKEPFYGFKDRTFPTASGRIECYKEELFPYGSEIAVYREPIEASPKNPLFEKYPLVMLSPHSRFRIHSTFANMEAMRAKEPEPLVRMNPSDAISRDISDGDIVTVLNDRGTLKIKSKLDDKGSLRHRTGRRGPLDRPVH